MVQVSVCARSVMLVHQVVKAVSRACCFMPIKHNPRDDIKVSRGPARDSATELGWGVYTAEDDDEDDNGPGSGDEDVLTSLGASYRAWRVYHREKRAHDYTKSRLVEAIRREATLVKQMARVGGSVEGIERTIMRLEDLEASVIILEEKYDAAVTEQVTREDLVLELEALQSQCQLHTARLHEAEVAALRWKTQCQQALPELASSNLEKERLIGELRKVKKTAVLMMNRQYVQLEMMNSSAPHLLPRSARHHQIEIKKRSHSNIEIA